MALIGGKLRVKVGHAEQTYVSLISSSGSSQSSHSLADSTCSASSVDSSNLNLDEVSKKLSKMGTSIAFVKPQHHRRGGGGGGGPNEQRKRSAGLSVIPKGGTKNVSISSSPVRKSEKGTASKRTPGAEKAPGKSANGAKVTNEEEKENIVKKEEEAKPPIAGSKRKLKEETTESAETLLGDDTPKVKREEKVPKRDYSRSNGPSSSAFSSAFSSSPSSDIVKGSTKALSNGDVNHKAVMTNGTKAPAKNGKEAVSSEAPSPVIAKLKENGRVNKSTPTSSPFPTSGAVAHSFNADIICQHGNLIPAEAKRRLVSRQVWRRLREYFPGAREFPRSASTCRQCQDLQSETAQENESRRELAASQKAALLDVFHERNRPTWSKVQLTRVHIVSRSFVQEWRLFVKSPQARQPVQAVGNQVLLCQHGGLLYPLGLDTESDYESTVFMVSEEEWGHIRRFFEVDTDIVVTRNKKHPSSADESLFSSTPEPCGDCVRKRHEEEERERLTYRNVHVYVRQLTAAEMGKAAAQQDASDPDFPGGAGSNGVPERPGTPATSALTPEASNLQAPKMNGVSTPTSSATGGGSRRGSKVVDHNGSGDISGSNGFATPNPPPMTNGDLSHFVRRSNRSKKVRGDKPVVVSSDMLLRDFKVRIMEMFKVAPFDQHLTVDDCQLSDSAKTLGQLKVLPNSIVYLRADEPGLAAGGGGDDAGDLSAAAASAGGASVNGTNGAGSGAAGGGGWAARDPEEGFKGEKELLFAFLIVECLLVFILPPGTGLLSSF